LATPWWIWLVIVPLVPVVLPTALLVAIAYVSSWLAVHVSAWTVWCLRGRRVLLVFSDSPYWKEFIGGEVASRLSHCAVVLNRSVPGRRRFTLAWLAYRQFGGWRDHCPLAVVFRPFQRSHTYRFHRPFLEWKHGKPEALRETVSALFSDLGLSAPELPAPPIPSD
jgi:hypothetical protein